MKKRSSYSVIWSEAAASDLQDIVEFIAGESQPSARVLFGVLKRRAGTLASFPLRGRLVPEFEAIGLDIYRELVVSPYRLIFRVKGRHVFVMAVFDGRRDLEDIFFERLTRR